MSPHSSIHLEKPMDKGASPATVYGATKSWTGLSTHIHTQWSDQIRSDRSLSHVRLFATPWIAAREASLSITNSRSSLRSKVYIFSSDNSSLGTYLFPLDSILKFTSFEILEEREAYSEMWCWQKSEAKDNDKGGDRIIKSKFTNWQGSSDLGGQSV